MAESHEESEVNLVDFLTSRARRASDTRLVLDAAIGLVAALIALIWRPAGWHLIVSAALCFAAFGGWGITDRELRESGVAAAHSIGALKMLRITRAIAASVGTLGAAAFLVGLLGVALGTWIS
jgi:hypothetical protein